MSAVDSIFLQVTENPEQVADWLSGLLGLEVVGSDAESVRLRGRGATFDGWLGYVVQPNGYADLDPEPDEIQAMDPYGIEFQIRVRDEDILHREARLAFDRIVEARPDVPTQLVENLAFLVAAHLPGTGTHLFEPGTTPDAEDQDTWRPWVTS